MGWLHQGLRETIVNNSSLIFLPSIQQTPVLPKPSEKEIKPGLQLPSDSRACIGASKDLAVPLSHWKCCFLFPFKASVQVADIELQSLSVSRPTARHPRMQPYGKCSLYSTQPPLYPLVVVPTWWRQVTIEEDVSARRSIQLLPQLQATN